MDLTLDLTLLKELKAVYEEWNRLHKILIVHTKEQFLLNNPEIDADKILVDYRPPYLDEIEVRLIMNILNSQNVQGEFVENKLDKFVVIHNEYVEKEISKLETSKKALREISMYTDIVSEALDLNAINYQEIMGDVLVVLAEIKLVYCNELVYYFFIDKDLLVSAIPTE